MLGRCPKFFPREQPLVSFGLGIDSFLSAEGLPQEVRIACWYLWSQAEAAGADPLACLLVWFPSKVNLVVLGTFFFEGGCFLEKPELAISVAPV